MCRGLASLTAAGAVRDAEPAHAGPDGQAGR